MGDFGMKLEVGTKTMLTEALRQRSLNEPKRDYLGVSALGDECSRKLWFKYHEGEKATKVEPRIQAIFDMGHLIEKYVLDLLISTGMSVFDKDEDGKQFEAFYGSVIKGHIDGVIKGIPESDKPHLLEIKSMNDTNFSKLRENIEHSFPHYWVQMQCYMFLFKLERGLFVAMNKDNCEFYTERVKLDPIVAESYLKKGVEIVNMGMAPSPHYPSKTFFKCRYCEFNEHCWSKDV